MVFRARAGALQATLRKSSTPSPCLRATARHTQVRWESTEKKPAGPAGDLGGRTFKGQLYESAAGRLERERAEQARFSKQRNEGAGGRNSALTFGMLIYNLEWYMDRLTFESYHRNGTGRILFRKP